MRSLIYAALHKFNFAHIKNKNNVRVLAYHTIPNEENFETQLQYLEKYYDVIDFEQLRDFLFSDKPLPERALLITFDDGDISVKEKGLPLLKKHNLPSVCFVITGLIDTSDSFWCRWIEKAFDIEGKSYPEARDAVNYYKKVPNKERIQYLESLPRVEDKQLSTKDLHEMTKNKMQIGNHTHSHPMVNHCTEEELVEELVASREKFQEWKLNGYSIFAYPNGNWDRQTERILEENDIEMAFLFDHKVNEGKINPLRISRIMVDTDMELNEFKVKVSGMHSRLFHLKNKFFS